MLDINIIRGIWTLLLIILFIGVCIWAYSAKRKNDYDEAAQLPLMDDDGNSTKGESI